MIEPVSDALTTSIRPACRAKNAMMSSAMLPNVALRIPPTCGPVIEPRRSVDEADDPGETQDGSAPRRRTGRVSSACKPEVEDDRGEARARRSRRQEDRATGVESWPRIGQAASGGSVGHRADPIGRRRRRRAGDAGCRSRRRPVAAASPRAVPLRPAARPRRVPPSSASASASAARAAAARSRPRPDDEHELAARPGSRPSAAASASSPSDPRDDRLVELGQLAADRRRPVARRTPRRDRAASRPTRPGASNTTVPRSSSAIRREPLPPLAPARAAGTPRTPSAVRPRPTGRDRRQDRRRTRDRHDAARPRRPRPRRGPRPGR